MRQRFEQQATIGIMPIGEVQFPLRSRDELPPVLKALQHVFITPELNEKIFQLLESKIVKNKKKTGRPGMDLWHILVLAIVRSVLNTNWDRLLHSSNYDTLLRKILGVHVDKFGIEEKVFKYQTIIDNVSLIDEDLLYEINQIVVDCGHKLLKKKDDTSLELKTDSFVIETNVHFPNDLNLLWDSLRKTLDMVEKVTNGSDGWRKIKSIKRKAKSLFRFTSQQVFRSGNKNPDTVKESVKAYLNLAKDVYSRTEVLTTSIDVLKGNSLLLKLQIYRQYLIKLIDQVERRIINGEVIPSNEKIYSIFEPHTEWINKGKMYPNVELGKLMLITTDQYQFIVDYKVMEHQKDAAQVVPLCNRLKTAFPQANISSHSFDKGFYSKDNFEYISSTRTKHVIMPKKGKRNKIEQERESSLEFKKLRRKHSAVESNINMLEHHGLNRCPDKGLNGLKEYVGFSVLAYNLHILGKRLISIATEREKRLQKRRANYKRSVV